MKDAKNRQIHIRVTEKEFQSIKKEADLNGLKVSKYLLSLHHQEASRWKRHVIG